MTNPQESYIGMRVLRGRDWHLGDQDGGEGMVGTVVETTSEDGQTMPGIVSVIWDNGAHGKYRAGQHNSFDLVIYEAGSCAVKQGETCDECQKDIIGIRWSCRDCTLISLCTNCYMSGAHSIDHSFERFDSGDSQPIPLQPRHLTAKAEIKGSFPGAIVVRGPDWDWDDQDGGEGQIGKILDIETWQGKSKRNVAKVQWMKTGISNIYRIGHKGKVDIKCVQPSTYGMYYKTHLPLLGAHPAVMKQYDHSLPAQASLSQATGGWHGLKQDVVGNAQQYSAGPAMASMISIVQPNIGSNNPIVPLTSLPLASDRNMEMNYQIGDRVRVLATKERLAELQAGHGGFNPSMESDIGKTGKVVQISETGDVVVLYEDTKSQWTFNSAALTKVLSGLAEGDTVQLLSDATLLRKIFTEDVGEWSEEYNKLPGICAKITKVYLDGNLKVAAGTTSLIVSNRLVECKVPQVAVATEHEVPAERTAVETRLLRAAKEGDVEELKEILESHPQDVNTPALDETPLLAAITEEREDIVEYLIKQGANVNIKDKNNHTAVHLALSIGNDRIIEIVLKSSSLDIDVLDDKYKLDYLQFAAICGSIRGIEILARRFPGVLKRPSSGPTPVHYAVVSSKQLLEYLIKETGFSTDCVDLDQKTPLHIAILSSNIDSCQLIVRLGCDVNAKDVKGNTALHMVLSSRGRKSLREHRWYTVVMKRYLGRQKIQKELNTSILHQMCDDLQFKKDKHEPDTVLACWLLREGANPLLCDNNGKSAFDVCYRHEILQTVRSFYDRLVVQKQKVADDQLPSLTSVSSDTQECKLCRNNEPCVKFLPCEHVITCLNCAGYFKKCYACDAIIDDLFNMSDISDCLICDINQADVLFDPCGHTVVCLGCSWRMKRCVYCKSPIRSMKNRDGSSIEQRAIKAEESKYVSLLETLKSLETKVKDMESSNTCSICLDRPKNVVFLCGHSTCTSCSTTLGHCPICRSSIDKKIVMFQ